ncbi:MULTISPECIES: hypothetical protein [Providencia]|uniref:hypothetical protein n=1 Tax=Providencia TaxID=586 RepID=UPI00234A8AD9|nr:hypothetical protein [Providencia sp. PROV110]
MIRLSSDNLIKFITLFIFLVPLFPSLLNESQYHVIILVTILPIIGVIVRKKHITTHKKSIYIALFFFLVLQILLIVSFTWGIGNLEGIGDIISLFRPLYLLISIIFLIYLIDSPYQLFFSLERTLKFILFFILLVSIIEVFLKNSQLNQLNFLLYKMERKQDIANVSVSLFVLPYYAAFALSFLSSYFATLFLIKRNYMYVTYMTLCLLISILTQSKTGIIVNIAIIFFAIFLYHNIKFKLFISLSLLLSIYVIINHADTIIDLLLTYYPGNLSHTIDTLVNNPEKSNTLHLRLNQFNDNLLAIEKNNILTGYGLGRDLMLESWLASVLVRYGIFGLFFYVAFFLTIIISGIKTYFKINDKSRYIIIMFCIWLSLSFISQLSAFMIESSKTAYIFILYFSIYLTTFYSNKIKSYY